MCQIPFEIGRLFLIWGKMQHFLNSGGLVPKKKKDAKVS